jgi:hypothetical protein
VVPSAWSSSNAVATTLASTTITVVPNDVADRTKWSPAVGVVLDAIEDLLECRLARLGDQP